MRELSAFRRLCGRLYFLSSVTTSDPADLVEESGHPYGTRAVLAAVAGLLVVHAALVWLARPTGIEAGGDDASYYLLGQALRHLQYTELWIPGSPAHRLYPPAYPALVAVWSSLAGTGFTAEVVLSICLSVATLAVAYVLAARSFGQRLALAALAVLAVNPAMVDKAGHIASEMPYALWSLLALALIGRRSSAGMIVAGACAIVAALTRTVGGTLLIALVAFLLLERRWKPALTLALASALTLGTWLWWAAAAPEQHIGSSYIADALSTVQRTAHPAGLLATLVGRLGHNTATYAVQMLGTVMPFPSIPGTRVDEYLWITLVAAGLLAGLVDAWRRHRAVVLYLVCYGALLLAWPFAQGRFLLPVAALLVPIWLWGVWLLARKVRGWGGLAVPVAGAALLVATGAWGSLGEVRPLWGCDRVTGQSSGGSCIPVRQREFRDAVRWVRDSTGPDAVVLTGKPAALFYLTGRRTLPYQASVSVSPDSLASYLTAKGARYVVLTAYNEAERTRLSGNLSAACRAFRVAAAIDSEAYVLRVRGAQDGAGADACGALDEYRRAIGATTAPGRGR